MTDASSFYHLFIHARPLKLIIITTDGVSMLLSYFLLPNSFMLSDFFLMNCSVLYVKKGLTSHSKRLAVNMTSADGEKRQTCLLFSSI